ncbi:hypothetical protein [Terriglobus roseus]|nr:hypothetical protein [Terriglobus roseus]
MFRQANAQEVIHARAGQVVAANTAAKTLTLKVADGSTVVFHDVATPEPAMSFDKDLRDKTTAAAAFHDVGAYVVVFYFGFGEPTAVAVESMGATPPKRTAGSVTSFDRHQHLLTLNTESMGSQKVVVSDDTILDTPEGVVKASNFHPGKGQHLRCFAKPDSQNALFVAIN